MATIRTCDRCDKKIGEEGHWRVIIEAPHPIGPLDMEGHIPIVTMRPIEDIKDLCGDCKKAFKNWLLIERSA